MPRSSVVQLHSYRTSEAAPRRARRRPAGTGLTTRSYCDQRMTAMRADRSSWLFHWRELAAYILPRQFRYLVTANSNWRGSMRNQRIIDSTTTLALRTLASGMMGGITSPSRPWFKLSTRDPDLRKFLPVQLWLDECSARLLMILAKSNFYTSIHSLYRDLGCFGTAPMMIYEDPYTILRCYRPTCGEFFAANDYRQEVDTLAREFTMSARQLLQQFGRDAVSENVWLAAQQPSSTDAERIVGMLIEPNDQYVIGEPGPKGKPYRQCYWEQGASYDEMLEVTGFAERPFLCARWDLSENNSYGDSPCMDALGDAMQLQVEQRRRSEAIEKMVRPPLVADMALKNQPTSAQPGGITYVPGISQVGMKPVYETMPELQHMVTDIQEVQKRIKEALYYDLFLMISQLDNVRTATEIIARKEEKLVMLGPVLDRFHIEALGPAVYRCLAIAVRAGVMPPPPEALVGQELAVEFTSMLAEAQKSIATAPMERVWGFAASIAQSGQLEVYDNLDPDSAIRTYNDLLGGPAAQLRPMEIVAQIRAGRAREQEEQKALALTSAAVEAAGNLSKIDVGAGARAAGAVGP